MPKDLVGNELQIGDVVLDLSERIVCRIVRVYDKSITTDLQIRKENEDRKLYGHKPVDSETCSFHKLATSVVKIVLPE